MQAYFPFGEELSVQNGVIFIEEDFLSQSICRLKILHLLDQSHTGIHGYWPGLYNDLQRLVSQCEACQTHERNQGKELIITHPIIERPWEMLGCCCWCVNLG